ncbi:hypothetical protein C0993_000452 [Termitomyces sp. T159_Od127]|nr:hypothetical protein C0993_000452 [Termitomyces sp. T159_Od127]
MKFSSTGACLTAVHLRLQPTDDPSKARATSTLTALLDNFGNPLSSQLALGTLLAFSHNILCNKYKGPNYPTQHPWTTLNTDDADQSAKPLDPEALDIKSSAQPPLLASSKMALHLPTPHLPGAPGRTSNTKELPPHRLYDHKINLEDGTAPPFGKIYNMSEVELHALKDLS